MRDARHLATLLVVLGAFALAVPAAALAGGSAGNNQYTNPFGPGTTTASQTSTSAPQTSSTSAAPAPPTPAAPPTAPTPDSATTATATTSQPTATAAAPPATATTAAKGLPRTGYAAWELGGFGIVMIAGGLTIRRRARRG